MKFSYLDPEILYRLKSMRSKNQPLAKALGLHKHPPGRVFDLCFGFGIDALAMAQWGCEIQGYERNLQVYEVAKAALNELASHSKSGSRTLVATPELAGRVNLQFGDSISFLRDHAKEIGASDILYLDPMYSSFTHGSAKPKKRLQFLREVIGDDMDREELLRFALESNAGRVVLKGPPKIRPPIKPLHSILEKSASWHIYIKSK